MNYETPIAFNLNKLREMDEMEDMDLEHLFYLTPALERANKAIAEQGIKGTNAVAEALQAGLACVRAEQMMKWQDWREITNGIQDQF